MDFLGFKKKNPQYILLISIICFRFWYYITSVLFKESLLISNHEIFTGRSRLHVYLKLILKTVFFKGIKYTKNILDIYLNFPIVILYYTLSIYIFVFFYYSIFCYTLHISLLVSFYFVLLHFTFFFISGTLNLVGMF